MGFSREKIIAVMEATLASSCFLQFRFAESFIAPKRPDYGYSLSCNRITHVLDGTLQLYVGSGHTLQGEEYAAGTTLVMKPFALTYGVWEKCHETFALVCRHDYMRIIHAVHDRKGELLEEPTDYYHLKDSLRRCTVDAINMLCNLHEGKEADKLGPDMLKIIYSLLLEDIKNSKSNEYGKAYVLWHRITEYLANSNIEEQSRHELADRFKVTESYISRLFSQFAGMTFKEYQHAEQLKKAVHLLDETNMTIAEIAWYSGFHSSSYFIRTFKQVYNVSPGFWRQLKN